MNSESTRPQAAAPGFSMDDFAKALESHDYQFESGQIVRGTVFEYDSSGAYVDIGGKAAAFVPAREASLSSRVDLQTALPLNEARDFLIISNQNADGQVTLSVRRLELNRVWERLAEMQTNNETIAVRVSGVNKGGVTADAQGLRGFIPRSQLVEREDLDSLIGKTLTVKLLEVNRETNKLVLSHRQAAQAASIGQFEIGQLVEGKVVSLKPFGLFVDLGGTTGLLHIKQISQNYISSLQAHFSVGQAIKVVITDLDEWQGRISLSTRVLESYPGEILEKFETVMAEAGDRASRAKKQLSDAE
ncbi:S1 RNA-binding domain-containing protein [Geitlerinema sp. PCC 7407]|uniref:S1 RNA-binding domain-containing protein n=1 Tax=Geitlerinema sp. PCC 7407 TaxID=1173025 RepID=UPI00029F98B6|nr:S1 RNA-binding domain-containing protein [Geitlerinema sp. PCC 7407]AFY64805.1 SSU ribosomal protein S1P [Geitlerinema sp. PCC 7407]